MVSRQGAAFEGWGKSIRQDSAVHNAMIAKLAVFQGYTTWNPRQDELMHCFKESIQRRQSAHTVTIRPATNRNCFALTQLQLNRLVEESAWHKDCADDGILLQQFVSTQIQTLKQPGHLLDTCRVNVKLTNQRRR